MINFSFSSFIICLIYFLLAEIIRTSFDFAEGESELVSRTNIPPIVIINRIYETHNLLSL
jgi:NADH:ubiquinone oxidoreductase subunit H